MVPASSHSLRRLGDDLSRPTISDDLGVMTATLRTGKSRLIMGCVMDSNGGERNGEAEGP